VYVSLLATAGVTVIAALVAVVTPDDVVSEATSVQFVPVVMVTAVNVATPEAAGIDVVPVSVQFDVIATVSVDPVPDVITVEVLSSTDTEKLDSAAPAFVAVGGTTV
jgi:hypothetical protein